MDTEWTHWYAMERWIYWHIRMLEYTCKTNDVLKCVYNLSIYKRASLLMQEDHSYLTTLKSQFGWECVCHPKISKLGGGFTYFLFSLLFVEMIQIRLISNIFQMGWKWLKPPTRKFLEASPEMDQTHLRCSTSLALSGQTPEPLAPVPQLPQPRGRQVGGDTKQLKHSGQKYILGGFSASKSSLC